MSVLDHISMGHHNDCTVDRGECTCEAGPFNAAIEEAYAFGAADRQAQIVAWLRGLNEGNGFAQLFATRLESGACAAGEGVANERGPMGQKEEPP